MFAIIALAIILFLPACSGQIDGRVKVTSYEKSFNGHYMSPEKIALIKIGQTNAKELEKIMKAPSFIRIIEKSEIEELNKFDPFLTKGLVYYYARDDYTSFLFIKGHKTYRQILIVYINQLGIVFHTEAFEGKPAGIKEMRAVKFKIDKPNPLWTSTLKEVI